MPFMPEMLKFCGKKFRVGAVAHKTCDVANKTGGRRVRNAVHLGIRCDGSSHGGCQAGCLLFWKTDWIKRVNRRTDLPTDRIRVPLLVGAKRLYVGHFS